MASTMVRVASCAWLANWVGSSAIVGYLLFKC
jgi:hypothetical protein